MSQKKNNNIIKNMFYVTIHFFTIGVPNPLRFQNLKTVIKVNSLNYQTKISTV